MKVIREREYPSTKIQLCKDDAAEFYWVVIIEYETDKYPEYVDQVGYTDIVDAAMYFGTICGQFITEM